jgi:hypothetical protein
MGLRESINSKPWLGWVMAGVFAVAGVVMYMRLNSGSSEPFSADRSTEMMTIKFTDTGDEVQMPRGRVQIQLIDLVGRGLIKDASQGIQNPKTGAYTGIPFDKRDWESLVNIAKESNKERPRGQSPGKEDTR